MLSCWLIEEKKSPQTCIFKALQSLITEASQRKSKVRQHDSPSVGKSVTEVVQLLNTITHQTLVGCFIMLFNPFGLFQALPPFGAACPPLIGKQCHNLVPRANTTLSSVRCRTNEG